MTGECRLCKQTSDLRRSHILPAGFYRRMLDRGSVNPNPIHISEGATIQSSRQVTEDLLCRACEQRFNESGERWVLANCYDGKKFPLRDLIQKHAPLYTGQIVTTYSARNILGSNIYRLTYFAASIFWRASVHGRMTRTGDRSVQLGPRYEEEFRRYLLVHSAFPNNSALVLTVSAAAKPIAAMNYPTVMAHHPIGCHANRFVAHGIYFDLLVGKAAAGLYPLCFVRSSLNLIHLTDRVDQWIADSCQKLAVAG